MRVCGLLYLLGVSNHSKKRSVRAVARCRRITASHICGTDRHTERSEGQSSVMTHMARARVRACVSPCLTCAASGCPAVWTSSHRSRRWKWRHPCASSRGSWGCMAWWTGVGSTCRWTHIWPSFFDGIPDGRRPQLALWRTSQKGGMAAVRQAHGKTMFQVSSLQHIRLLPCTVKGKLSPLRACGSRTWVSTPRRTDPRLPVPIILPLVPQRGKSEPRGECSHETCRLGSA